MVAGNFTSISSSARLCPQIILRVKIFEKKDSEAKILSFFRRRKDDAFVNYFLSLFHLDLRSSMPGRK